jgi:cytochrome c
MALVLFLVACGSGQGRDKSSSTDTTASNVVKPQDSTNAAGNAGTEHTGHPGYAIMQANDCKTCHTPDKPSTGPSFAMIAARYDSTKTGTVEHLAKKVLSGGSGSFGTVPMTPHASLTEKDAEQMVRYILSYKN